MIGFDFTCYAPRMRFRQQFDLWGDVDEHEWRDNGSWPGHDVPNLGGKEISWHVETEQPVFDYYAECMAEMGKPLPGRIPNFAEFWREQTRGMIWLSRPDTISITMAAPQGEGFVPFMSNVIAAGMSLKVSVPLFTFATRDDAPAPTVEAFMHRSEPVFFTEQAAFWPYHRAIEVEATEASTKRAKRGLFG